MKLKYQYVFQKIGKTIVGVPVGQKRGEETPHIYLNGVSYDIASQMNEEVSREALVDSVLDMYDTDRETAEKTVDEVLEKLREEGVLDL